MSAIFESEHSFHRFAWAVNQPTDHAEEIESFLKTVLATAGTRKRRLNEGSVLWRAQCGYVMRELDEDGIEVPDAFLPQRMKPLSRKASEGRANCRDAPCLYLSDDADTAMGEVRPWVGAQISLALFRMLRDIVLIDCSLDKTSSLELLLSGVEMTTAVREQAVWGDIAQAFSKPLTRSDSLEEYRATQVLSQRFKAEGYDGVGYKSALGKGKNIALFDLNAANPINGTLYDTESVTYSFRKANNTYCIPKYYPEWAKEQGIDPSSPAAENPHFLRVVAYLPVDPVGETDPKDTPTEEQLGRNPA